MFQRGNNQNPLQVLPAHHAPTKNALLPNKIFWHYPYTYPEGRARFDPLPPCAPATTFSAAGHRPTDRQQPPEPNPARCRSITPPAPLAATHQPPQRRTNSPFRCRNGVESS